jgi:hypothetical protein
MKNILIGMWIFAGREGVLQIDKMGPLLQPRLGGAASTRIRLRDSNINCDHNAHEQNGIPLEYTDPSLLCGVVRGDWPMGRKHMLGRRIMQIKQEKAG